LNKKYNFDGNPFVIKSKYYYRGDKMADLSKFDLSVQQCFKELPYLIQETIMQSGVPIKTKEDLYRFTGQPNPFKAGKENP
jgi:hypothetical protein